MLKSKVFHKPNNNASIDWSQENSSNKWTGITNQQAHIINSIYKSNDDVYSRVDILKSDSNINTLPFPKKSTE